MEKKRDNSTTLVVARKATGKSTDLHKLATDYIQKTGKRALIIDVNQAPAYSGLPMLSISEFKNWASGSQTRIARFYLPGRRDEMLGLISTHFRNGLAVFEDCTTYIKANPQENIRSFLVDHRMWNVDLIFTFHSLQDVPPFFWRMSSHLLLGKTQDILEKSDKRRYPNFQAIEKAHAKVTASKNNYLKITVDTLI